MASVPETKKKRIAHYTISVELPELPDFDSLPDEDGENLESDWHRLAMNLLIEVVSWLLRDHSDFYVGGNMVIYFKEEQVEGLRFRGPDFFFVNGVNREPIRRKWVVMKEGGKYPDVIIEFLSESTATEDRTTKKNVYESVFHTHEYYCYDPETGRVQGWRLVDQRYEPIAPNERGWVWCKELNLWLGTWEGDYLGVSAIFPRFYTAAGELVPIRAEAAELETDIERRRAETAEAEIARLKALLGDKEGK